MARKRGAARDHGAVRLPAPEEAARALALLDRARAPLFREMRQLAERQVRRPAEPEHYCCTRAQNRMRISTLEALAIVQALHRVPELRARLAEVRARVQSERALIRDSERLQNYECPLLAGTRCLVHRAAKPIACLAWNPGVEISETGWQALAERDRLNDKTIGKGWELKAIPLLLAKYLDGAGGAAGAPPVGGGRRMRRQRRERSERPERRI